MMITVTPRFLLGVDIGSTAIKAVVVDAASGEPILARLHASRKPARREAARGAPARLERETPAGPGNCQAFATGSAAGALAPLIGARALSRRSPPTVLAVERRHPDARTIVELGGHDAKIVIFEEHGGAHAQDRVDERQVRGRDRRRHRQDRREAEDSARVARRTRLRRADPLPDRGQVWRVRRDRHQQPAEARRRLRRPDGLALRGDRPAEPGGARPRSRAPAARPAAWRASRLHPWPLRRVARAHRPHLAGTRPARRSGVARRHGDHAAIGCPLRRDRRDRAGPHGTGRTRGVHGRGRACGCPGCGRACADPRRRIRARGRGSLDGCVSAAGTHLPAWQPPAIEPGSDVHGFIGLDAGSTSTKAVVLDADATVLAKAYQLSRGNPIEDAVDMFRALRRAIESQGARLDVRGLVTTGYAKDTLKEVFAADAALVETVAHAQSALQLYEDPHVIVDVGGQDIKIIVLRGGRVKDFRLNTQCSAGNGYFLQAIAGSFGFPVEAFAEAAFSAREMPVFSHGCVLFLQSEIADMQRRGWRPEEVLAGLAAVLPRNVFLYVARAPNLARLGRRFVLQGGTQRNLAAVKAQVDFIRASFRGQDHEPEIVLHRHAGEAGAIGAALEAIRLWREGRATSFVGLDAAERIRFSARSSEETRCHYCRNECLRTIIDVWTPGLEEDAGPTAEPCPPGRRVIMATCEKGAAEDATQMRGIKSAIDAVKAHTPNLVALAAREVWKPSRPPLVADTTPARRWTPGGRHRAMQLESRRSLRVGIPRVFYMYVYAPLFGAYLESLGLLPRNIVYSDFTTTEMYRDGTEPRGHRSVLPVEGRARARAQPAAGEARAAEARRHLLPDGRRAAGTVREHRSGATRVRPCRSRRRPCGRRSRRPTTNLPRAGSSTSTRC